MFQEEIGFERNDGDHLFQIEEHVILEQQQECGEYDDWNAGQWASTLTPL